jgi:xanthine dehydrogenase small subunit
MADTIRFYYRNKIHSVQPESTTQTVLQYLREDLHCTGTKEGCAEGDCGACTVVLAELLDGELQTQSVNACIQFLPALDGKALFTVEDLQQDKQLHPVQQALVGCHASQCGFCTPGFAMSLWDLYLKREDGQPSRKQIDIALSGNLCRCTGYKPLIQAAQTMCDLPAVKFDAEPVKQALQTLQRSQGLHVHSDGHDFFAPRTLQELLALRADRPGACVLAGSTDVGLWVTKQMRDLREIIYLGQVAELKQIRVQDQVLEIGAGVTLDAAYSAVCAYYPQALGELQQRFASLPIRHAGTLGGNVANGSPIGDSMPWLIALGSDIVLQSQRGTRVLALDQFYLGYQKKDLAADEILTAIRIPLPRPDLIFRTYKLAKRFDQDISAVCAAFAATLKNDRLTEVRIAYGGMAATPMRASRAEAALEGQSWGEAQLQAAMQALAEDYAPLSDMRASSTYRLRTAQNLLRRFWLETRTDGALTTAELNVFAQDCTR